MIIGTYVWCLKHKLVFTASLLSRPFCLWLSSLTLFAASNTFHISDEDIANHSVPLESFDRVFRDEILSIESLLLLVV